MTYRDDLDPLREQLAGVRAELAEIQRKMAEAAQLQERARQLEDEATSLEKDLRSRERRRPLPLLDNIRIASPCDADWDDMIGNERKRFCAECSKDVFNLSAMTGAEAEALLTEKNNLCVRLFRRTDGTVLTADCPVGVSRRRRRYVGLTALALGILGGATMTFFATATQGKMPSPDAPGAVHPPAEELHLMGAIDLDQRPDLKEREASIRRQLEEQAKKSAASASASSPTPASAASSPKNKPGMGHR